MNPFLKWWNGFRLYWFQVIQFKHQVLLILLQPMHGMRTRDDLVVIQGSLLDRGCLHWMWLPDTLYLGGPMFVFKSFQVTMAPISPSGLTPGQLLSCTARHFQALKLWFLPRARWAAVTDLGWGLACHLLATPFLPTIAIRAPSAHVVYILSFTDAALRTSEVTNLLRVPIVLAALGPAGKYLLFRSWTVCLRAG